MLAEKPIIMTGESVRAILEGRKTQTRRVIFKDGSDSRDHNVWWCNGTHWQDGDEKIECQFKKGMRLWVKETYRMIETGMNAGKPDYKADDPSAYGEGFIPFKSPLFMKREHSRLTLEVTGVRAEKLQRMTSEDANAEAGGVVGSFTALWDKINGKKYPWKDNPWVWVIEFKHVVEPVYDADQAKRAYRRVFKKTAQSGS